MGKKKEKAAKKAAAEAAAAAGGSGGAAVADVPVPWPSIDAEPLAFLVAPMPRSEFLRDKWERAPAVFKATPQRVALARGLCTLPAVLNFLRQREKRDKSLALEFGVDVNAARYVNNRRETPNGDGPADAATLARLHDKERCTLQLHQPQRFFEPCWRLLAALERELGCLVGSNAYLTPSSAQGLAPHCDGVEIFVLHTSPGSKTWSLWPPVGGFELPNAPSGDLDLASLGPPSMTVELHCGDVLYMPRGTVHQAIAGGDADSSHVTISTFDRTSYGDLAAQLLQVGLATGEEPEALPLAARRSPAPGTLLAHSLHRVLAAPAGGGAAAAASTTPDAVRGLAAALRAVAAKLEETPDMLTGAVHASALDFLAHRLPPHPSQLPKRGPAPTLADRLFCRVAGWSYLLPFDLPPGLSDDGEDEDGEDDDEEEEEEEEDKEGGGGVKIVTCLTNSREQHMIQAPPPGDDSDSSGSGSGSDDDEGGGSGSSSGSEEEEAKAAAATNGKGGGSKKHHYHHHHHEHDEHGACCGGGGHGAGVEEVSLSEDDEGGCANPIATLPGLVLEPGLVRAAVAFMGADGPGKAIAVRDLPGGSDAQRMQLAFALWAEGLASTLPGAGAGGGGGKKQAAAGKGGSERPAKKPKA